MKNIYIAWHFTTHGIAYFKHILSAFYLLEKVPSGKLDLNKLEQEELNDVFNQPFKKGFLFDEIIYLTAPQEAFDKLSGRRFTFKETILKDELIKKMGLGNLFEEIINNDEICYSLDAEFSFVGNNFPDKFEDFRKVIWRNIHHFPINEQLKWLTEYSNFKNVYSGRLKVVELKVNDLRDEKQISDEVRSWLRRYLSKTMDIRPIINVSLGSNETQVVWHILAESGQLPDKTRFIKTYDDKNDRADKRFKQFAIKEIPTNLVSTIGASFEIYPDTKSHSRELVNKKMEVFLKSGFSILLIGERGIGKSQIAGKAKERLNEQNENKSKGDIIEANCASFANDSMAESELFGYKQGAFTDAKFDKKGLIEAAENGILFLDEVHHLSKAVQAKLMKALQTDEKNRLSIRRLGDNKEIKVNNVRLIFATNQSVTELYKILLPDFYDRIVQHVVHIPPLRETLEDRLTDWKNVWDGLKLTGKAPDEPELVNWLKQLPLYGNYRDLQKIAMYYHVFNQFDEDIKKMSGAKSAFHYAKNEFEKYHANVLKTDKEKFNFNVTQSTKEMLADYLYEMQNWAVSKFGGRKSAVEHFKRLGDTVTEKTFNDWKNKKSVNKSSPRSKRKL